MEKIDVFIIILLLVLYHFGSLKIIKEELEKEKEKNNQLFKTLTKRKRPGNIKQNLHKKQLHN